MSLFTLIRYPVDKDTCDFDHVPDRIWFRYIDKYALLDDEDREEEKQTNRILINMLLEWDDNEYISSD